MSDSPARWVSTGGESLRGGRVRRMSLTEMTQRGEEFERMPPHDVAAEQCVLGGMLLSKDAISDVIEVIRPTDHYRPAHQLVREASPPTRSPCPTSSAGAASCPASAGRPTCTR